MNTPLITWSCIAALFIAIMLYNLIRAARHATRGSRHHRLIELGTEREELFLPGDPSYNVNDNVYDLNDD
ncbi:MAG: hypothetical protein Q4C34_00325 [Bacteroidales bacterium]|nr:hypothetical protein [Bacteroidales bacterium]